jgi:RNA polymerase sigma-70 factor (ECF subfamily)
MDDGDVDAQVYEKYADELIRFASSLVGPSDASDVLSVAVIRAITSPQWPGVSNRRAYLYRSVLNAARSRRRAEQQRRARETRYGASVGWEPAQVRPEVLDAIGRLSARQRAVVYLTYWDDLDPAAAAELLGISEGSVRRHLARARANRRRTLRDA